MSADNRLGICFGLENLALSQWEGYNFNSMCKFGDVCLGVNSEGLFKLNSGDLDYLNEIDAWFKLILTDFGIANSKRVRKAYISGEGTGTLELELENDEENKRRYLFSLLEGRQGMSKVAISRDGTGVYWSLKLKNINGNDFSIDSIELALEILNRK